MKDFLERVKKHKGERLISIVCTDMPNSFELKYFVDDKGDVSVEEVRIPRKRPIIPSLIKSFPVASFYEREIFEGFGVKFRGHELKKLFIADNFEKKYPMRRYD